LLYVTVNSKIRCQIIYILGDFLAYAKLLHTFEVSNYPVLSVSSIDNQIFVLCSSTEENYYFGGDLSPQICVYNASTFKVEGHIQIPKALHAPVELGWSTYAKSYSANSLQNTHALTACSHNKCLYISDKNACLLHNVPVNSVMFSSIDVAPYQEDTYGYPEFDEGTPRTVVPVLGRRAFGSSRPMYGHRGFIQASRSLPVRAQKQQSQWSVQFPPTGLSINSAHNVLVACGEKTMFLEYTTDGSLVRRVTLQPHDIVWYSVEHVVQLCRGRYGIIGLRQGRRRHYCIVDDYGQVLQISHVGLSPSPYLPHGQMAVKSTPIVDGSGLGVFPSPRRLDVSRSHFLPHGQTSVESTPCTIAVLHPRKVLITDPSNNRILVLTEVESTLTAECLAESVCGKLSQPSCMHYDASKGRLYIADTGHILCCGK